MLRVLWLTRAAALALLLTAAPAYAQHEDGFAALNRQLSELHKAGRYAEAIPIAERYVEAVRKTHGEEHDAFANSIAWLGILYQGQRRFDEAEPWLKRSLAVREKALGPDHLDVATSLDNLAKLYQEHGPGAQAELLYKRALALREAALGPNHPDVATSLNNLADLYLVEYLYQSNKFAEAEPLYKRALAIRIAIRGPDHPDVAITLNALGKFYGSGRRDEALSFYNRALAIREKSLGPDALEVAETLDNLAELYRDATPEKARALDARTGAIRRKANDLSALGNAVSNLKEAGKYAEAVLMAERSLLFTSQRYGEEHTYTDTAMLVLGSLYAYVGRYADAEPLYQRFLANEEKKPQDPHDGGTWLVILAELYLQQGRYADAEPLFKRILALLEKNLGPENDDLAPSLDSLAIIAWRQGREAEAESLFKRAASLLSPDAHELGISLNHLGQLYQLQGRYADAEPLFKRSLSIYEERVGSDHPNSAQALRSLALLYLVQGRNADAEPLLKRGHAVLEKTLGADDPAVAGSLADLGRLYFARQEWGQALIFLQRAAEITIRSTKRDSNRAGRTGKVESEAIRNRSIFFSLLEAADRLKDAKRNRAAEIKGAMFRYAQWAQTSEAAASLAQMAARQSSGDGALARLVRERQDLVTEWQNGDRQLATYLSQPADDQPAAAKIQQQRGSLARIDKQIAEIDSRLEKELPEYVALSNPDVLAIADVQTQLKNDEALVLFLDMSEGLSSSEATFIWVIAKSDSRWLRIDLGTKALGDRVGALRCGLDSSNWIDAGKWTEATEDSKRRKERQVARRDRCKRLTGADVSDNDAPPFDLTKANDLYRDLFGKFEDLIKNKQLLIVPSGPLTQLPFQVLVTDKPVESLPRDASGYEHAEWLIKRHAISVLPSVASLKSLRHNSKASGARHPFIGFGNPILVGMDGTDKRAFAYQSCADVPPSEVVELASRPIPETLDSLRRGGVTNVAALKHQLPLPETAQELCAVALELGAVSRDVYLGTRATETEIKKLSTAGDLAQARVVHFATHGLIASETETVAKSLTEPALMLSPPETATAEDDGLLTASEVLNLKLDADWVVLSACNTAAGGENGTEALSGLAQAFFYAGTRALLASHWYVDSDAAVKLTTGAFAELKRDPLIGRAEALRRAMLAAMADRDRPKSWTPAAHPSNWAPFVLVGEGAAPTGATAVGGSRKRRRQAPPNQTGWFGSLW